MSQRHLRGRLLAMVAMSVTTLIGFPGVISHAATGAAIPGDGQVQGIFTSAAGPAGVNTTDTIPYWKSSFTFAGTTYPFAMAGSNPATNTSTTIPTVIIPLKFIFSAKSNLGGGNFSDVRDPFTIDPATGLNTIDATIASPIFQNSVYPDNVGTTQWGDAIMRATFNKTGTNGYHVLLGTPTVMPEVTINVPANQADVHAISARIDISWFDNQINQLMNSMHIDPHTIPIFATYDTLLYLNHDPSVCCVLGYHGAASPVIPKFGAVDGNGSQPLQTFIFDAWISPGIVAGNAFGNIAPLSHEVSEYVNDPFGDNFVPPWLAIAPPPSFCQGNLETGDVLEDAPNAFMSLTTVAGLTYSVQSEALLPWFERQSPSSAVDGVYSFPDSTLAPTFAQSC